MSNTKTVIYIKIIQNVWKFETVKEKKIFKNGINVINVPSHVPYFKNKRHPVAPFSRVSRKHHMLFCVRRCLRFDLNVNNVSAYIRCICVYVCDTLKMAPGWHGGDKLLNKVVIFVFFANKKYSRSFVKLRLNPWCHMDYFNDVLATFLSLDRGNILAFYGRDREFSEFIKNIFICVPKMNKGLTGLERHEGE